MTTICNGHNYFVLALFCLLYFGICYAANSIGAYLNYKGKYTTDIQNYEIIFPQRVNEHGNFISHVISHQHSKRSTKERELIFYKVPIGGKEYLIELTPNRKLISPGAVVETHKITSSLENGSQEKNSASEKIKKFKSLNMRKLKNTECHFSGHVRGENISKAAISTCYGLAGFIQIERGFYTIEPVAEHDPFIEDAFPHILYKSNDLEDNSFCSTTGKFTSVFTNQVIRKRRDSNISSLTPMYMETLIVIDKSLINYHKESDCENYVLTVFNMAFNLFHDASIGLMISPTIVRIIRLEVENVEMNLKVNTDAVKTLEYFQNWQYEINPGDDTHPNHHDVAVLLTRVDVCYSPSSCGLLGLSTVGKACDPKYSAVLCEDNGLRLGFVIAHEIGHLLGADHDTINSACNGTELKTIMHPQVSLNSQTWSKCSQAHFKAFFKSGLGTCFLDEPEDHHFNVQDLLPGVMYNADFQCKHIIAISARECDRGSSCNSLNCYVPGYACILTHTSPADGTRCGESMWCHDGKCIVVGQRPGAIDGNWGEWSSWSDCTRTCGSGVSSSVRQCDKPLPSHGGKNCVGERKRFDRFISDEVNVSFVGQPCKTGRPSFRDVQCGEFDDWIYPEDGKKHVWRAFYQHEDNPCKLYCINEEKTVAALRPRVVDGTMCYRGIRDICVGGTCKTLPCDLHFESNAVEDVCGVCHGDGTGCEFSGGTENLTKSTKGMTKLIDVPSGTRNIKVEEISTTSAKIIVKDKESKDVYVQGSLLGTYSVPGSQAWLGMIKKNQEALCIPGPITKPISIWIYREENATVKWSMALPPTQQRKPEFAWDFMKWGPCSARCGPGTQKSEPSCMEEKAGLVENTYCVDLEMPPAKVRSCEVMKCEARWMVGDWKGCEKPYTSGKIRKRVVYCIKPMGEGEGESQLVSDSECHEPKPHESEPCENRQKREDTEYNPQFFGDSFFISDTAEFGFHKKYDDYLTHFAALSVPQRKSETVPLHLLSSPHFKHYFRVLETPEGNSNDGFDVNFMNSSSSDHQNQNKLSPDFYKNTFSGNPIDVSHMQSQFISIKARKNVPLEKPYKISYIQRMVTQKELKPILPLSRKRVKGRRIFDSQTSGKKRKTYKITPSDQIKGSPKRSQNLLRFNHFNDKFHLRKLKRVYHRPDTSNLVSWCRCIKRRNPHTESKRVRHSLRNIFLRKHTPTKNFNYTSPNLTDVINNLSNDSVNVKKRFMKLIWGGKQYKSSYVYQKGDRNQNCWRSKSSQIGLKEPTNTQENCHNESQHNNSFEINKTDSSGIPMKNLKIYKQYDGSGVKKLNCTFQKHFDKSSSDIFDGQREHADWIKNTFQDKRVYVYNSPLSDSILICNYTKPKFKGAFKTIQDLFLQRKSKRLLSKTLKKRNTCLSLTNAKLEEFLRYNSERSQLPFYTERKLSKRLTHKWKKQKLKDLGVKGSKDCSANGCGTETRNYLNNLFRDTRAKVTPKPEAREITEKTIINTGQLVIDKDPVESQQVEIVLQEDYEGESENKFKSLPLPSLNEKLTLQGQQVFDLYQNLQKRTEHNSSLNNDLTEAANMELGVMLPSRPQTTEPPDEMTDIPDEMENDINDSSAVDFLVDNKIEPTIADSLGNELHKSAVNVEDYTFPTSQLEEPSKLATTLNPMEFAHSTTAPPLDDSNDEKENNCATDKTIVENNNKNPCTEKVSRNHTPSKKITLRAKKKVRVNVNTRDFKNHLRVNKKQNINGKLA